jgi:hypothetical protein
MRRSAPATAPAAPTQQSGDIAQVAGASSSLPFERCLINMQSRDCRHNRLPPFCRERKATLTDVTATLAIASRQPPVVHSRSFRSMPQFCTFVAVNDDKSLRIGYDFSLRPSRKVKVWWSKSREEP